VTEALSRGPRAWPLADRQRPGAPSTGTAAGGGAGSPAYAAAIAAVMASRDVTA